MRILGVGAICAFIGAIAAVIATLIYAELYDVQLDIGFGFLLFFVIPPAGGVAGLISGMIGAQIRHPQGRDTMRRSIAIGVGITLAVIGGGAGLLINPSQPSPPQSTDIATRWLYLEYELRLPAGQTLPKEDSGWAVILAVDGQRKAMHVIWKDAAMVDGRPVMPGSGYLISVERKGMLIARSKAGNNETNYPIDLPADPTAADKEWSEWRTSANGLAIRTRVQLRRPW